MLGVTDLKSREMARLVDLYLKRVEERSQLVRDFYHGSGDFLVIQRPFGNIWGSCNSVTEIRDNNIAYLADWLKLEYTQEVPYLEPWIGTGAYANAFGCEYVWRTDNAPHVHYKYRHIAEVKDIPYPDWRQSPVLNMVLDTIDTLKEATGSVVPITLTDTQSAFDTATLILDAAEYFTACYDDHEIVLSFTEKINNLVMEFSRVQIDRIGDDLLASPGHIMVSQPGLPGISISDDNLAVASPQVNESISLPLDQQLAEAFGGLAVHSCGPWANTMARLKNYPGIYMIDCAAEEGCDPTPNRAEDIAAALSGSRIIAKVRVGGKDFDQSLARLTAIAQQGVRLVAHIPYDAANAEANYHRTVDELHAAYR